MTFSDSEQKRIQFTKELQEYRLYKDNMQLRCQTPVQQTQQIYIPVCSSVISSFTSEQEVSITEGQQIAENYLQQQSDIISKAQNYLNTKDQVLANSTQKINLYKSNISNYLKANEQNSIPKQKQVIPQTTYSQHNNIHSQSISGSDNFQQLGQSQNNLQEHPKTTSNVTAQPEPNNNQQRPTNTPPQNNENNQKHTVQKPQPTKFQQFQSKLHDTNNFITHQKADLLKNNPSKKQIYLQNDLQKTISELSEIEHNTSQPSQHPTNQPMKTTNSAAEIISRQSKILNNLACSDLILQPENRLETVYLAQDFTPNPHQNPNPHNISQSVSVQIQCENRRKCRKPQLSSSQFVRVQSFAESFGSLSQTSQDYLRWRRGAYQ